MLRLSGAKEQLKMGGICAVNRQTLFTVGFKALLKMLEHQTPSRHRGLQTLILF